MSSFFNSTNKLSHKSKLPEGTTAQQAIDMLHDHHYFFECNPHTAKFELLKTETTPTVPDYVKPVKETESYQATDIVHALPAGLWDSNVVSTYEFTDIAKGVFVRIRSPLSVVMETVWEIQGEDGQLELVEEVSFTCSRLLAPVVRSQCEGGWAKIHAKMVSRFE
ncbi:hypothetical protein CONLIGDRAFT_638799 [Coniochaeta ligniaria NRRL 30616]|uniref:DUF7053 domain-containing protein n=1 Tax=Coniochaeta ligniaria NRRL 30616 TaxID=1408157 RepID=A0A1J7JM08_9PEZI|nr:hypothetical protein CONLIGDRAFT_638799 [Coniochaeta ligniaria NRRL 30616]